MKKQRFLALFTLLSIVVILQSCSDQSKNQPDEATAEATEVKTSSNTPSESETSSNTSTSSDDKSHRAKEDLVLFTKLDNIVLKGMQCPWFATFNGDTIYYVASNDYTATYGAITSKSHKMGLLDKDLNELLPMEYYKIYNIGTTAKGWMVVEKANGLKGLFNPATKELIQAKYTKVLSAKKELLAYLQLPNNSFDGLTSGGTILPNTRYSVDNTNWQFDALNPQIVLLRTPADLEYQDDPSYVQRVMLAPDHFVKMGMCKEIQPAMVLNEENMGVYEYKGGFTEEKSMINKITAFVSAFYESGSDARGYSMEQKALHTIDENVNVIGKINFPDNELYGFFCEGEETNSWPGEPYRFVSKDTVECLEINSGTLPGRYNYYRNYQYYKINANGRIDSLRTNRAFRFTKFVRIDPSYLSGKTIGPMFGDSEGEEGHSFRDHYTIEDLDLMRNEIFADYGFKFKSDKWKTYFNKQKWYVPQKDNVDEYLTPIDQHNIKVILAEKKKLQENEKGIVNARNVSCGWAG